tara:strand:+ start:9908 stop:11524 length:1617 start_codon:yes stop_codon:yes gene_type:complete
MFLKPYKFIRPSIYIVFAFLILSRLFLWLSIDWSSITDNNLLATQRSYKIDNLPIHFMVYWPDSGRYWPLHPQTFIESLIYLKTIPVSSLLQYLFFLPIRVFSGNIAFAIIAQNILSLTTAWVLYIMLKPAGKGLAALTILLTFGNLLTVSLEYALLREILNRFLVIVFIFMAWKITLLQKSKIIPQKSSYLISQRLKLLTIITSIIMFLMVLSRPEMIMILAIFIPIFYLRWDIKFWRIISATGIFSLGFLFIWSQTIPHQTLESPSSAYSNLEKELAKRAGPANLLLQTLLIDSYDYKSHELNNLPKKIYSQAKKCEEIFHIKCQTPPYSRYQFFQNLRDNAILDWAKKNEITSFKLFDLYWDIFKYNTRYIFYSAFYSLKSYFLGKMDTVSPLIYAGKNKNYISGWPYFSSSSVFRFGDPLSELSPKSPERGPRWLYFSLAPFSEQWLRTVCAPFFLIGLYLICKNIFLEVSDNKLKVREFWRLGLPLILIVLPIMSVIGVRNSRYLFYLDPFIFASSALGIRATLKWFFINKTR